MPELPEVETIARQLNTVLTNRTISAIEVRREKSFQGDLLKLINKKIAGVGRKQKIVVITFTDPETVLLVHLKMTGQLIFQGSERIVGGHPTKDWVSELPSKHSRVVVAFADESTLYFNDQRVFGWMKVLKYVDWQALCQRMAPDVVDAGFTVKYLAKVLSRSSRPVKLTILDQNKMGGMGNIYANDALFMAGIHPFVPSNQLKYDAVKRLHEAMKFVINKGIEMGGSSISDYVDSEGVGGHYQDHFLVYDKEGEQCSKCQSVIEKVSIGGRGTYFCPRCQMY